MKITYMPDGQISIIAPAFSPKYLSALFRSKSAAALIPLFAKSNDAAKEWTESYAAHHKLRKWIHNPTLALHVGDGAHARTAALFAFHTGHANVSIDPLHNPAVLETWQAQIGARVDRLSGYAMTAQDWLQRFLPELEERMSHGKPPILLTFVHAHVGTREVLAALPKGSWAAAYTCSCCETERQLMHAGNGVARVAEEGQDWGVLSPQRTYQVLVPA